MFKKFLSALICLAVAFTVTISAFAQSGSADVEAASSVPLYLKYYYDQMSDDAQTAFLRMRKAILNCNKKVTFGKELKNLSKDEFSKALDLICNYDPMVFNVNWSEISDDPKDPNTLVFSYYYKKSTYDKMVTSYEKKVDKILGKFTDDTSTYKKIKIIHDEIIKTTEYDTDAADAIIRGKRPNNDNSINIYGTLVEKEAVCEGYAETFAYICGKAGIRAICVAGDEYPSDNDDVGHEWNKVYYNKQWYNVDVTWDDYDNNSVMKENTLGYDYFMISDKQMFRDHRENNANFKLPKATDDSKSYYVMNKKYAESLDSAKKIVKSGITSAAKNNSSIFAFQCSSKTVYNKVQKYLAGQDIFGVISSVKKSTNKNLVDTTFTYISDDSQYTIIIMVFYKNTSLDKYYNDTSKVSKDMKKALKESGIQ